MMQEQLIAYFVPRIGLRLLALVLTLLFECSVAWVLGYRKKDEMAAIICINVITNPILNYVLWVMPWMYDGIWLLEGMVVLVEWFLLRFALMQKPAKLLGLALAMNATSFLGGMLIFSWILG